MRLFLILLAAAAIMIPAATGVRAAMVTATGSLFSPAILSAGAR